VGVEITACNKIGTKLSVTQADCLLVLRKLDNLVKLFRKPVVKLLYATAGVGEYLYRIMPEHMTVTKFREGAVQSLLCYRESFSVTVCKYPKDQREA